jgi:hypothetical protein
MKFTKPSTARQLLAIGLLSTTIPTLINDFVHVPDFVRGLMLGLGLGLEVIGIIFMRRERRVECIKRAEVVEGVNG